MISRDDTVVIRWGQEQARVGPWQGDDRVAYLVPLSNGPAPSLGFVRWTLGQLSARGFTRVVTNALPPVEQVAFLGAGFEVQERLHLLGHDLRRIPDSPSHGEVTARHRRARSGDHCAVLDLDAGAFPAFWRLDGRGLDEALRATPRTRFRVVILGSEIIAYALTGRARRRGFLQRLAVDPVHRRQGLGRELVVDALRWLRRRRVERAVVNTPTENEAALALYESLGFRQEPPGLSVLALSLGVGPGARPWAERRESSDR